LVDLRAVAHSDRLYFAEIEQRERQARNVRSDTRVTVRPEPQAPETGERPERRRLDHPHAVAVQPERVEAGQAGERALVQARQPVLTQEERVEAGEACERATRHPRDRVARQVQEGEARLPREHVAARLPQPVPPHAQRVQAGQGGQLDPLDQALVHEECAQGAARAERVARVERGQRVPAQDHELEAWERDKGALVDLSDRVGRQVELVQARQALEEARADPGQPIAPQAEFGEFVERAERVRR
jgi:hypothetical protein